MEIKEDILGKSACLKLGLTYVEKKHYNEALSTFEQLCWANYSDCVWLRRTVISPLIRAKKFNWAEKLLQLILNTHPSSILDLITLSSILIRQNKRSEGCIYLERILAIEKENYKVAGQLIQLKYQDEKLEDAVKWAEHYAYAYEFDERLLKISFMVLTKAGKLQFCIKKILEMDFAKQSLNVRIMAAQIAFDAQQYLWAEQTLSKLQTQGYNDARIGLILARIKLIINKDSQSEAIAILKKANEQDPENIQINNLLGELLIRTGHYVQSLSYLEKLKTLIPQNPQTRLLYARALKFTGNYDASANEMLEVVTMRPDSAKWKRYAAAALIQANRYAEAKSIFDESLRMRGAKLPDTFESGLNQLSNFIQTVNIPEARFDWLWSIVKKHRVVDENQRISNEKSAKWVNLLDHFLIDWLECRPQQADEAMLFFDDLSEVHNVLSDSLALGKGIILAGAHIGPLFSIPLALELLGLPHKWLASTPSISSMSYKNTLISTSENSETEIVRQVIKSLHQGNIVAIAVDGSMNPSAPRIDFENQEITYSDFAAKMIFRTKGPSFVTFSYWENNRFCIQLLALPTPFTDETPENFCARWQESYLNALRQFLIERSDNARLSGGIWRHIKETVTLQNL